MTVRIETLWQVPAYLPYLQPPLTDAMVAEAERQLGYPLPKTLLALLRRQNGGYIRYGLRDLGHSLIYGIGPHYPSLTGFDWDEVREEVSFELDGLIPFDGDGHWHLCLDYRGGRIDPAVTHIEIDDDQALPIADSFDDYLQRLELETDDREFVLSNVADRHAMLNALAARLGVAFDPPDSWAHGYPVIRAAIGNPDDHEWIWIAPNLVPRGFARAKERCGKEYEHLRHETALRYPELPATSDIVVITDAVQAQVLRAFADLGLDVRPLRKFQR